MVGDEMVAVERTVEQVAVAYVKEMLSLVCQHAKVLFSLGLDLIAAKVQVYHEATFHWGRVRLVALALMALA